MLGIPYDSDKFSDAELQKFKNMLDLKKKKNLEFQDQSVRISLFLIPRDHKLSKSI
jgi:hypothetical protein